MITTHFISGNQRFSPHADIISHLFSGDCDGISQLTGFAVDLDAVVQELLERSRVEDPVLYGNEAVDDKLQHLLLGALLGLWLDAHEDTRGAGAAYTRRARQNEVDGAVDCLALQRAPNGG